MPVRSLNAPFRLCFEIALLVLLVALGLTACAKGNEGIVPSPPVILTPAIANTSTVGLASSQSLVSGNLWQDGDSGKLCIVIKLKNWTGGPVSVIQHWDLVLKDAAGNTLLTKLGALRPFSTTPVAYPGTDPSYGGAYVDSYADYYLANIWGPINLKEYAFQAKDIARVEVSTSSCSPYTLPDGWTFVGKGSGLVIDSCVPLTKGVRLTISNKSSTLTFNTYSTALLAKDSLGRYMADWLLYYDDKTSKTESIGPSQTLSLDFFGLFGGSDLIKDVEIF